MNITAKLADEGEERKVFEHGKKMRKPRWKNVRNAKEGGGKRKVELKPEAMMLILRIT